jgi:hypothetical protein
MLVVSIKFMIRIWNNEYISYPLSELHMHRILWIGLSSFKVILVSIFRSFLGFGSTNRGASTTRYTRASPYLFVDASLLNENIVFYI